MHGDLIKSFSNTTKEKSDQAIDLFGICAAQVIKLMESNNKLFESLIGNVDTLTISTAAVKNRVVASGEKIRAFHIVGNDLVKSFAASFQKKKFESVSCYCSVYNDCWIFNGNVVTKSECKESIRQPKHVKSWC